MIRVSLSVLVFVYLFGFLAAVLGVWLWSEYRRQRRERLASRNRIRCSLCSFEYEDVSTDPLARCPRCGSLNERDRVSLL